MVNVSDNIVRQYAQEDSSHAAILLNGVAAGGFIADGFVIANNTFNSDYYAAHIIDVRNCENVVVSGNVWSNGLESSSSAPVVWDSTSSVSVAANSSGNQADASTAVLDCDLTNSFVTLPRPFSWNTIDSGAGFASGEMALTYGSPLSPHTFDQLTIFVGDAGGGPTLCRLAVYSVNNSSGDLTLLASTANDTSLITDGWTSKTKALNTNVTITPGNWYAWAILIVSSAGMPRLRGTSGEWGEMAIPPRVTGHVVGLTDLPSVVDSGDIWDSGAALYIRSSSS
jgi:hypothetical protein